MLKLLKFEFNRKRLVLLIALAATLLGEVLALAKYYSIEASFRDFTGGEYLALLMVVLLIGFSILYLIDLIGLMRQDMFKQEGYMLFMTPNSGYKILGAKLLFAFLEGIAMVGVYFVLLLINFELIGPQLFQLNLLDWHGIQSDEWILIVKVLFLVVFAIIEFALTVYFSFAIFKGLFNNNRFKGLITFGIFIGVSLIRGKIGDLLTQAIFGNTVVREFVVTTSIGPFINFSILESLVWILILFLGTGYLIENKVNL
ncbi:MAG: hypothetical protein PWQ12_815 [Clostridiales bacterium]|jgi:hypothetical protein|nr:hypothetical protein [Clostridiales bacterium]